MNISHIYAKHNNTQFSEVTSFEDEPHLQDLLVPIFEENSITTNFQVMSKSRSNSNDDKSSASDVKNSSTPRKLCKTSPMNSNKHVTPFLLLVIR